MRRVQITWLDSMLTDPSWEDISELLEMATEQTMKHLTVGWLVAETPEAYLLALHRNEQATRVACSSVIPKLSVLHVCDLV